MCIISLPIDILSFLELDLFQSLYQTDQFRVLKWVKGWDLPEQLYDLVHPALVDVVEDFVEDIYGHVKDYRGFRYD